MKKSNEEPRPTKRYYVYTLAHPNGMIFYIGKGSGGRTKAHLAEARSGCRCDKCQRITKIWKERLEVKIEYVFETDNRSEALAHESDLITRLQRDYPLCNLQHNLARATPRKPHQCMHLSPYEYIEYLSYFDLTKKERKEMLFQYGWVRVLELEVKVTRAIKKKDFDKARELIAEIESTNAATGRAKQRQLPLV